MTNTDKLTLEHWPIDRFVAYSYNPRKNDEAIERMRESITKYGFRVPILARSDGTVVDGHLRIKAAVALGLATLPVLVSDTLTENETRAFRILVNASANWAEWDETKLRNELEDLSNACYDLSLVGLDAEILSGLVNFAPIEIDMPTATPLTGDPAQVTTDMAGEGNTSVQTGAEQIMQTDRGVSGVLQSPAAPAPENLARCPKCGFRFKS